MNNIPNTIDKTKTYDFKAPFPGIVFFPKTKIMYIGTFFTTKH